MQASSLGSTTQIDFSTIVTRVRTRDEVRSLPPGAIVGDAYGGATFSDSIAAELEKRSFTGWQDVFRPDDSSWWTVIVLNN